MSPRLVIFLLLCFVVVNLFIGLFHLIRGNKTDETKHRVVRSLTIRVATSIVLFSIILVVLYFSSPSS